ncbi:MAG: hypothetical protein F6K21_11865 [Symploca sp. SIO2D2]|nr:hypothetical protein [Symploca sp. SIO2D2]
MDNKDFNCLILALEITVIVVELLSFSQPLGLITGVAVLIYLYFITEESPSP